ncbi:heat shock protein 30 [Laetiporus sulphureus 93-53]|uniref:Heat shock protein 30 n=1 Tax=Laetiporus sulphureus 93-53 TaxID=1314785 RepID=A0A165CVY0_9APHY|nr:heat shock protein 30 [Laetiporus sulphureus 93-53]KZT03539.1 heat shock protein 30 [Laetiporus sulphureus 93-53]
MGNDALRLNPPNSTFHLSTNGSDWLWAVFSIMAVSLLAAIGGSLMRPKGTRLFHQIAVIVLTTASIAYFSMASDLGATPITVEFRNDNNPNPTRQIWYVRYIQWFITFPLLLLECLLATGLSLSDIMTTLFMAIVLVVCGLIGALVHSTYKWGYFVFGVCALFYIWYVLLLHAPSTTFAAGGETRSGYYAAAGYLSFMLITYPICWACSEGGNVITVTSEMIWYGILDILTGPVFLAIFLWELRSVDYEAFGFNSGKYVDHGDVPTREKQRMQTEPATHQATSTGVQA